MKQKIIDFLLDNADPSIVLRVKKEILNSLSKKEEKELLSKILPQKNVQIILKSQKPDGWLGNNFHGQSAKLGAGMYDNMEVGLRYLAEKGLTPENEYVKKAVKSFLQDEPFFIEYRMKAPITDYSFTASGVYLVRSSIIIRAGYEYLLPKNDFIDLNFDINVSLNSFLNVLNYRNIDEVIDIHRKKLCFKKNIIWPCSYDLRMLAHSQGWRNKNNISLLADSMNHLFSFQHCFDKMIYTYINGQYVGPCLAFIHNQIYCLGLMNENHISFDLMELFARCGVVKKVNFLKNKYEYLLSLIDDNLEIKYKVGSRDRDWSPYYGFALEEDWKTKIRKKCDLLFRILLINHHIECT